MEQSKMSSVPSKKVESDEEDEENEEEDQEIEETLESLQEHLAECKKLGKYVEAQMTKNRIDEFKQKKANTKFEKLMNSQEKELKLFKQTHDKELASLEQKWNKKLQEYEKWASQEEKNLVEKQEKELEKAREEVSRRFSEKVHPSPALLSLKKKEEALANQNE